VKAADNERERKKMGGEEEVLIIIRKEECSWIWRSKNYGQQWKTSSFSAKKKKSVQKGGS